MKKFNFETKKSIIILAIIFISLILFLHTARYFKNQSIAGEEPYLHLRISEEIRNNGVIRSDNSLVSNPLYNFNLIELILAFLPTKELFMILIPGILGLATIILFHNLLKEFKVSDKLSFHTLAILILSPPFIYAFYSYTNLSFLVFFNVLFAYLYVRNNKILAFASIIPTLFISLPSAFLTIGVIFFLESITTSNKREALTYSAIILLTSIIIYFSIYYPSFIPNRMFFTLKNVLTSTISDLGSNIGVSIFQAILAVIGVFLLDNNSKKLKYYLWLTALILLSMYYPLILLIINFGVSYLAAYAIYEIYHKKWEIKVLRNITIILIIYGLIFSAFSFQTRIINDSPTKEEIRGLEFLKSLPEGTVLSHKSNGYFIEYFSKKQALIDGRAEFLKGTDIMQEEINQIFTSRNLKATKEMLSKNNVTYIFIDPEMKEGLVFEKRNQGLLFILDNSQDDFERIYNHDGVEVWRVKN